VCAAGFVALATLLQLLWMRPLPAVREPAPVLATADDGPLRRPRLGMSGFVLLYVLGIAPMTITAIVFHASWYGENADVGTAVVASSIALLSIVGIPGALFAGWLADHAGVRALLLVIAITMLIVPLAVASGSLVGLLGGFALAGIASGASGVAGSVAWSRTYGDAQIGRLQGIGAAGVITGASLGPLIPSGADLVGAAPWVGALVLAAIAAGGVPLALRWRPAQATAATAD
jgi:MFS family permease